MGNVIGCEPKTGSETLRYFGSMAQGKQGSKRRVRTALCLLAVSVRTDAEDFSVTAALSAEAVHGTSQRNHL